MRVSALYGIAGSQGSFEFVDVDVDRDIALFIDPAAIANIPSPWTNACTAAVQSFFQEVLDRVVAGDAVGAKGLLGRLSEENATHLGFSSQSQGSGLGPGLAARFYKELSTSQAVKSGLIADLEDTALLIEGVREDRISDVVTNIIRNKLIEFTQATCTFHGIPMNPNVAVGSHWITAQKKWSGPQLVDLPVTTHGPLILVPKSITRRSLFYDAGQYYRHYVLEFYRDLEYDKPNSPLVYLLKSGIPKVNKGDIEKRERQKHSKHGEPGIEKRVNTAGTQEKPDLLSKYKEERGKNPPTPLPHDEIADATGTLPPDYDALLAAVVACTEGAADATKYEKAVEALLSALFYPDLVDPIRQDRHHEGRKIIDITFTNTGRDQTFFAWLAQHYPSAMVAVECKNYSRSLANPEFDQIAGRFSPSRGRYGLLVYRKVDDKKKVMATCRDTANDDRGWITPLDDDDLAILLKEVKDTGSCTALQGLLHKRFLVLIK